MPKPTEREARIHALIASDATIADMLRRAWPRHTAKLAAQAAGGSVATAKAWVAGRFTPSADTLLRMAARNEELRAELLRRLGAHGYVDTAAAENGGMAAEVVGREVGQVGGLDRSADGVDDVTRGLR